MRRFSLFSLKCSSAAAVFVLTVAVSSANDIEDFLKAMRRPAPARQREFTGVPAGSRFQRHSSRPGIHGDYPADSAASLSRTGWPRGQGSSADAEVHEIYDLRQRDSRLRYPVRISPEHRLSSRRGQNFAPDSDEVSEYEMSPDWSYQVPPVPLPPAPLPTRPLPPARMLRNPSTSDATLHHHEIGDIVHCPVVLEPCVRIEDPENIAPQARPVVIAVRDPRSAEHHSGCDEGLVYVVAYVPPCPPDCITISPCGTRITLSFGDYDVKIHSCRGWVVVAYRD